jgi:hypothetical protein
MHRRVHGIFVNAMIDLRGVSDAISALHDFIANEPRLHDLLGTARELERQAWGLAQGGRDIEPVWPVPPRPTIPDRELAKSIVRLLAKIPLTDGDEDRELASAIAHLYANIAICIASAVFRSYPDVVPRIPPDA